MINIITINDALRSLRPTAQWVICGETIEWINTGISQPTDAEIAAEIIRLQEEYDAKEYARKRVPEYPPIGDQLDALWKGGDAAAEMLAKVQAVKAKYPKP